MSDVWKMWVVIFAGFAVADVAILLMLFFFKHVDMMDVRMLAVSNAIAGVIVLVSVGLLRLIE